MTLILATANRDGALLVSDRRLTVNGRLVDIDGDERNKATAFFCADGRFAAGFTGLAQMREFQTEWWLATALLEAARPDHLIGPTMERLTEVATTAIGQLRLDASSRRLSLLFVGYHYGRVPRACFFLISNYDSLLEGPRNVAGDQFRLTHRVQNLPLSDGAAGVLPVGHTASVLESDLKGLFELVQRNRPLEAIREKALSTLRQAADSSGAQNLIGKQATSLYLPVDPNHAGMAAYHSEGPFAKQYTPNVIVSTRDAALSIVGHEEWQTDEEGNVVEYVPRVGRNKPCPCGSGAKFKRCHGKAPTAPRMTTTLGAMPDQ